MDFDWPRLDHDSEFFKAWHSLPDGTAVDEPLWLMGSLFALVEIGGMNEWAQIGTELILKTRKYIAEAGAVRLVQALDEWMAAIPGGFATLDHEPRWEALYWDMGHPFHSDVESPMSDFIVRDADKFTPLLLDWYRANVIPARQPGL
ncbi:hypothetical protein [Planctomyces sp. SH-PL14]|uniref:hypothetical protein n=1 Tax=Planctomyces sp. SH-PL14 TaxID=1632864 RepID=UPI00078D244B|nr:hypothetical protein [Planctomyces sp. SH-PL14]AMV16489.1 hypothetical protein VT03_01275 [Planctomyces sp. SH-PL14]